ncbi:MAG: CehA/McbA family metallohydrolase [Anaerolineae bacterium]|nr:CehA/McbA family metallohydrolase [Anaerolineae bacterium]
MTDNYREYVGNLHVHTLYSDGHGTHQQITDAAAAAELDFVITTDHNTRPTGLEGYYGRVLLLLGEEVHNVQRHPQVSHLLIYGTNTEIAPYSFSSAQMLINKALDREGICYIAHPVEKRSPINSDFAAIPWADWPIKGIHGLEIWNYMSEFKGLLWSKPAALIYALRPDIGIRGPFRSTLKLWDELLNKGYHLAAIGNADAHAAPYSMGPIKRVIFPYEYLFRCVNTHILTSSALTGDAAEDKVLIYDALRNGRTFVGYDLPHPTRGFSFTAHSGSTTAVPGEDFRRLGATTINIRTPASGEIRLLRDGKRLLQQKGTYLTHTTEVPGIYRAEVYKRFRGRKVGWIFSSPIYVE